MNNIENSSVPGTTAAQYYDPRSIINPAMVSTAPANLSLLPNPFMNPTGGNIISMQDQNSSMKGARADVDSQAASARPY